VTARRTEIGIWWYTSSLTDLSNPHLLVRTAPCSAAGYRRALFLMCATGRTGHVEETLGEQEIEAVDTRVSTYSLRRSRPEPVRLARIGSASAEQVAGSSASTSRAGAAPPLWTA
jgi:hypothetical protein